MHIDIENSRKSQPCRCSYHSSCLVSQSCLTFCNPKDCSPLGSSFQGISQARILEWVAISLSRDPPNPGMKSDTWDFCIRIFFYCWATREAHWLTLHTFDGVIFFKFNYWGLPNQGILSSNVGSMIYLVFDWKFYPLQCRDLHSKYFLCVFASSKTSKSTAVI